MVDPVGERVGAGGMTSDRRRESGRWSAGSTVAAESSSGIVVGRQGSGEGEGEG